jgi:hypothetical protein
VLCSPGVVDLDLQLANGSNVRVNAVYNVELFGLVRFWSGTLGGSLRSAPSATSRSFLAFGATTDPVISGIPGTVCGARINIAALDLATAFPWDFGQLVLDVVPKPGGTGASVGGSFGPVRFEPVNATGRALVR